MRIAIVEDEKVFAEQLVDDLQKYGQESGISMEVRWFTDGAQIIGDYRPEWDLILLDIEMARWCVFHCPIFIILK